MNWGICLVATAAVLAAQAAHAQPVSYDEALREARQNQPVLQARELQVEARRNTADAAAELPDPRLKAGLANFPITGPSAFEFGSQLPTQLQIGVEQEIPNLAKRRARTGLAQSDISLAEAQLSMSIRDTDVAAGQAWIALAYSQRLLALAVQALNDLRDYVPVARSAVASGTARPAESLAIRRSLLKIEDAQTAIEADRETAQARLTRYIASEQPFAQGSTPSAEVAPALLRASLQRNPALILADAAAVRAEALGEIARAEKRPDFGINVTYGRRGEQFGDVVSVLGSVTLPVFAGRRQDPRIAAAQAEAAAALAEREDRLRDLEAQFEADVAAWRSALRQWQRARAELLPLARDREKLEIASFAAGRAELIDVIEARTALALLELEILEREEAAVQAAAKLRLTYGENQP